MQKNNNLPYKLIVFDIDGTILDNNHKLDSGLKEAIATLKQKGYIFSLISARPPKSVLSFAKQLDIGEEVIALNGSLITNTQHDIIYSQKFSIKKLREVLDQLPQDIAVNYYEEFNWYLTNPSYLTDTEQKFVQQKAQIFDPNLQLVNKVTLIAENERLIELQKIITQDLDTLALFSHANYLELTSKTISKFIALEYYAKLKQIDTSQIIAFGDGENDIPMLKNVGLGIAMSNAKDHVKSTAKLIAGYNFEDGVSKFLYKLIGDKILII